MDTSLTPASTGSIDGALRLLVAVHLDREQDLYCIILQSMCATNVNQLGSLAE